MKFKNKLNTLLVVSGCDFLFEPNEEREFKEDSPYIKFLEKSSDLEKIGTVQYQTETVTEVTEPKIEEYDERTCFICGFQAKTTTGLATHKRKKHNL